MDLSKLLRVMNMTAILLLSAALACSAGGHGQGITLKASNAPLSTVIKDIEKQSGYQFFYKASVLDGATPISIRLNNVPLAEALDACLKDQPVTWSIVNKVIILQRKPLSPRTDGVTTTPDNPQPTPVIDIKGRVVNEKSEPVIATVTIKGSSKATSTDANGHFELKNIDENATLVISGVNIESYEVKIAAVVSLMARGNGTATITVKNKMTMGEEVMINTGYQNIKPERFVGSSTKIDSTLFSRQVTTDLISRLDGITNSLLFDKRSGRNQRLQIRGVSSINSDLNPLIILDNFPYTGDINNINPNDIESITILKDAAASSIWGARAGNGVIVITTKKGKYNQPLSISVNSNITIQDKPDPFFYPRMSSADFIDVEQFLFNKGFYNSQLPTPQWYVLSPVVEILNKKRNGIISDADATAQINNLRNLDVRNDYNKYVFREAINQQNHISFTGGDKSARYAFSFGYDRNLSNIKGPGSYNRYTINSNTTFKLWKVVELSTGINLSKSESKADGIFYPFNPGADKQQIYPYAQFADAQGNHLAVPYTYSKSYVDTAGGGKLLDWYYRPLDELNLTNNSTKQNLQLLNLSANFPIRPWLLGEVRYQYGKQSGVNRILNRQETFFTRDLINLFTQISGSTITRRVPLGSILDLINSELNTQNFRGQLNLNKKWGGKNEVTGLIAGEFSENKSNSNRSRFYGYNPEVLTFSNSIDYVTFHPIYTTGTSKIPNPASLTEGTLSRFASFLVNVSYLYNRRYTLYASARRDGANLFGVKTNNKWKPLWSIGGSWDLSKEDFYKISWLPYLRVRSSYGYTGNANNTISGLPTIRYLGNNPYTQTPIAGPNAAPNPGLRWEQVKIFNVGIDFNAFKNRLSGSIEWFHKNSDDLIAPTLIDPTTGVTTYNINFASLKGTGVDISVNTDNTIGSVRWETSLQFSHIKSTVSKYYNRTYAMSNFLFENPTISPVVGSYAYPIYSYKWGGLIQ